MTTTPVNGDEELVPTKKPPVHIGKVVPAVEAVLVATKAVDQIESQDQDEDWVPEPSHADGKGPRIPLRGTASGEANDGDENRSAKADGGDGSDGPERQPPKQRLAHDQHPPTP